MDAGPGTKRRAKKQWHVRPLACCMYGSPSNWKAVPLPTTRASSLGAASTELMRAGGSSVSVAMLRCASSTCTMRVGWWAEAHRYKIMVLKTHAQRLLVAPPLLSPSVLPPPPAKQNVPPCHQPPRMRTFITNRGGRPSSAAVWGRTGSM